jgi:hypothetical protein
MIFLLTGLFLPGLALAAPPGFAPTRTTDSCQLFRGPALPSGVVPLMAECRWPTVSLDKIDRIFSPWQDHDLFFSAIAASDVERTEGGAALVRQVHQARGITDRECLLRMTRTPVGSGFEYRWALEPSTPAEGRVAVAHDVGYWRFTPNGAGVDVVYYLEYGPGGSVPGLLVRWFQTSGFEGAITELRAWMESH